MAYTKRQIIAKALSELGLGQYALTAQPQDMMDALSTLNIMMGAWHGEGVVTGFAMSNTPTVDDLDKDSGIAETAVSAVINSLAIEIAPSFGKQPFPATQYKARRGFQMLQARTAIIPARQSRGSIAGAGHKRTHRVDLVEGDEKPSNGYTA